MKPPSFIAMHMLFLFILALFPVIIFANLKSDRQALLDFTGAVPHARKLNCNSASTTIERIWTKRAKKQGYGIGTRSMLVDIATSSSLIEENFWWELQKRRVAQIWGL